MTPAFGGDRTFMLGELSEHCGLPEAVVEKWVRAELLPAPLSGRFGFRALGTARTLTQLHRAGWTAQRIKSRLRRRKDAVDQFTAAIARAPDYAEAWNNLGIVRGEVGDGLGAVAALERALALVPYYADAHYNLGEALSEVGEHERAREHYRAYLTFDPNSRWAEQARRRLQNPRG